jgi:hypothetical protein
MSSGSEKDQSNKHVDWEKEEFAPLDTKRPTIPEKVAEYIDAHKKDFSTLFRAFDKANNYVREWLASDNENMQTFVHYYNDPTSVDIVKRELYVIKAPLVWSETEDVFFKHDGGGITSWGALVHNISEASKYTYDEAKQIMRAFGINWFLVQV